MKSNEKEGVCYPQPHTLAQRSALARDFLARFRYTIPLWVDPLDDRANEIYAGWPERLYIVDEDGFIAYKGRPGPFGYDPDEVEAWLKSRFPS